MPRTTTRRQAAWPAAKSPTMADSGVTPEQIRRAQLSVAHHATSAADCAELLDMLGLRDPDALTTEATEQGLDDTERTRR